MIRVWLEFHYDETENIQDWPIAPDVDFEYVSNEHEAVQAAAAEIANCNPFTDLHFNVETIPDK